MTLKDILKTLYIPLIFLFILRTLFILWKILDLPPQEEVVKIAKVYFDKYGLITVFISSIIEGLLLLGIYYPGSLVIFLGVIFAGSDILAVIEVVSVVIIGMLISFVINFFLGKYGWYKLLLVFGLGESIENTKNRLIKYGFSAIFWSYILPNLAAFTSTAAGILQFSFRKFLLYSFLSVIFWDSFWGALVYFLGEDALNLVGFKFAFVALAVWIIVKLLFRKHDTKDISGSGSVQDTSAL